MESRPAKRKVLLGLLGSQLDAANGPGRWERWRPTVSLGQHSELLFDRFELMHEQKFQDLADRVAGDFSAVSPETQVCLHEGGV